MKKKTTQKITFYITSKFSWLLILLLGKLCSIKFIGRNHWKKLKVQNKPFIFIVWHGRLLLPIFIHRNEKITPIISLHADGEMIAQTVQKLGYKTVRGSTTRGGKQAFHDLVHVLKMGGAGAIMPDGPQGPRHRLKRGALYIAQKTDAFLIPITFSCKRKIEFKSWDRFNLITPFSKAVVIYGKPFKVPPKLPHQEFKELQKHVENTMIQLEKQADEYFKH